jgi:hypothetical protein
MRIRRQSIGEQAVYPGAAKFAGRQADAVHDDEFRLDAGRPRVVIRGSNLRDAVHQPVRNIDLQIRILA